MKKRRLSRKLLPPAGWRRGPRSRRSSPSFSSAQEVRHAVATSSCTTALHLALIVAGIGPGDDVVVPSLSFIATANAVTYVGARPVFCDVDPLTGNVTAETIHAALTLDTRAVIVVDQGGVPVDLDPIRELCDRHEITVIEDAACAVGSQYKGRPVGTGADVAVWSFHPRQGPHHRRGRHAHHTPGGLGGAGADASGNTP